MLSFFSYAVKSKMLQNGYKCPVKVDNRSFLSYDKYNYEKKE